MTIEACRTETELRTAYAGAMAKQVASDPQELAVLRARFRRRGRELKQGLGASIEGRAAWILACFESSLPDEQLQADLRRLHADDPKLDVDHLRSMLAAREAWKEARADPEIPPVVLHVLQRRLGVPPRARATAQDVAHPRQVAERMREAYPAVHALDPDMFQQIGGMPATPSRATAVEQAAPAKTSGRVSFWMVVFAIWLVAKLLGLAVRDKEAADDARGLSTVERSIYGAEYDRAVRRLEEVRELEREVRLAEDEAQSTRAITVVRRQRLRERIEAVRIGVKELRPAKTATRENPDYPDLGDLADLDAGCQKAVKRLLLERAAIVRDRAASRSSGSDGGGG